MRALPRKILTYDAMEHYTLLSLDFYRPAWAVNVHLASSRTLKQYTLKHITYNASHKTITYTCLILQTEGESAMERNPSLSHASLFWVTNCDQYVSVHGGWGAALQVGVGLLSMRVHRPPRTDSDGRETIHASISHPSS